MRRRGLDQPIDLVHPRQLAFEVLEYISDPNPGWSYYHAAISLSRYLAQSALLLLVTGTKANLLDPICSQKIEIVLNGATL
jgi:hypothetical protein